MIEPQRAGPGIISERIGRLESHDRPTSNLDVPRSALAVGAHPDDIEIGCGATFAKWAAAGCSIHHLVLTDGSKGTWDRTEDSASLVARRQTEQSEAARRLGGGEVVFLGRPDGELRNSIREQWELCRHIRQLRPEVVLGHDPWRPYRLHPDHRNAGFLLTDSVVAARDPLYFADQELEAWRPRTLLLFEAGEIDHIEDVTGFEDTKVDALLAHESQYETTFSIDHPGRALRVRDPQAAPLCEAVRRHLTHEGRPAGFHSAEGFHRLEV
ncbi:MAG: PIG-L deacetylase family protein [Acidimicrobiales bacterium]